MPNAQVNIATISCQLFDLVAFSANPEHAETILRQDKSTGLRVSVELGGSGAIALMPLGLTIQVEFFAKALGLGETVKLGNAMLTTQTGQFLYTPTLKIPKGLAKLGLQPDRVYQISALLRVGSAEGPALINGFVDSLTLEVYAP